MGVEAIIALIAAGTQAIQTGYNLYQQSQSTMSETDLAKIKAALEQAQAATAIIRPQVDAALDAAAKE